LLSIWFVTTLKAYEAERRRFLRHRAVSASLIALILIPLFGIVDYFAYPPHFRSLMTARLASGLMSLGLCLILRSRRGLHNASWLSVALVLETGLAICAIPVLITGTDTPHYVSTSLLILSVTALLPWTATQVGFLAATLAAMFVSAGLLHGSLPNPVTFWTQVSAVLITGVLAVVITTLAERTRRREVQARHELRRASREKTHLIQNLEKMTARLATLNEDLQERQRETNDFLYVLSHDLRAPLINIQGFGRRLHADMAGLEASLANGSGEEALKRLERMQQSLQFLNAGTAKIDQLISRLLEIARLSTRPGRQEWNNAGEMVRNIIDACRFQLEARGVEVAVGELPRVWGDPVQLNQVFTNLVDNAVKYMGKSEQKRIDITCSTRGDRFRFAVRDTGPGIAPKDQEKVFRLFSRLAGNGSSGEGVGLAAVRAIVNRHGGRIWVESTPGDGSTFYFTLPREPSVEAGVGARSASPPRTAQHAEEVAAHV
jgi:signal transduction histidine kinase